MSNLPSVWTAPVPGGTVLSGLDVQQGNVWALASDAQGNAIVGGAGYRGALLTKVSPTGTNVWGKIFPGANVQGVTVDGAGDVVATGIVNQVNLGGSCGVLKLPSGAVFSGVFIAKFSGKTGDCLWAKAAGGNGAFPGDEKGASVATDPAGNVYVTGRSMGPINFAGGDPAYDLGAGGNYQCFFVKLTSAGAHVWSRGLGPGVSSSSCNGVVVDGGGSLYVTGSFWGQANFGSATDPHLVSSVKGSNAFAAKLDTNGGYVWTKPFFSAQPYGAGYDFGNAIAIDPSGADVAVTGIFSWTADFSSGTAPDQGTLVTNNFDAFVVKLAGSDGSFQWAKGYGLNAPGIMADGISMPGGKGIAIDASRNIVVSGKFFGSTNFGTSLPPASVSTGWNGFVVKYAPDGTGLWDFTYGPVTFRVLVALTPSAIWTSADFGNQTVRSIGWKGGIINDASGTHDIALLQLTP
jgi:hypothetical protein